MQTGSRLTWDAPETATDLPLLKDYADAYVGLQTGDDPRYIQPFWAFESADPAIWQRLQNAPTDFQPCDGTSWLVRWEDRSEEHTSELQSRVHIVYRLLL